MSVVPRRREECADRDWPIEARVASVQQGQIHLKFKNREYGKLFVNLNGGAR